MDRLQPVIRRFNDYYASMDTQPPETLNTIYHPNATLADPFGEHRGLVAIHRYFAHLLKNVERCRFSTDGPLISEDRFAVSWIMNWSHPRIAGGKPLTLAGCSVMNTKEDLIIHQRDYYDAGEMIYEHLPLLGSAVRSVKKRVRS